MDSFIVKASGSLAQKLDSLVAKNFLCQQYFVQCGTYNVPRQCLHCDQVIMLLSRKALAGTLLDEVVAEVKEETKKSLERKNVTLIENG